MCDFNVNECDYMSYFFPKYKKALFNQLTFKQLPFYNSEIESVYRDPLQRLSNQYLSCYRLSNNISEMVRLSNFVYEHPDISPLDYAMMAGTQGISIKFIVKQFFIHPKILNMKFIYTNYHELPFASGPQWHFQEVLRDFFEIYNHKQHEFRHFMYSVHKDIIECNYSDCRALDQCYQYYKDYEEYSGSDFMSWDQMNIYTSSHFDIYQYLEQGFDDDLVNRIAVLNLMVDDEKDRTLCTKILEKHRILPNECINLKNPVFKKFYDNCLNYKVPITFIITGNEKEILKRQIQKVSEMKIIESSTFNYKDYIISDWLHIQKFIISVKKLNKGGQHKQ